MPLVELDREAAHRMIACRFRASSLVLLACAACQSQPSRSSRPQAASPVASSAAECVGGVAPPGGLTEIRDDALLRRALGKPGEGQLCQGKVFEASSEVVVYRVWDEARPSSRLGNWWSLSTPQSPFDDYRRTYAICRSWNALNRSLRCTLTHGARVVVGPGQSAQCDDGITYPASPANQVFIADVATSLRDCTALDP